MASTKSRQGRPAALSADARSRRKKRTGRVLGFANRFLAAQRAGSSTRAAAVARDCQPDRLTRRRISSPLVRERPSPWRPRHAFGFRAHLLDPCLWGPSTQARGVTRGAPPRAVGKEGWGGPDRRVTLANTGVLRRSRPGGGRGARTHPHPRHGSARRVALQSSAPACRADALWGAATS